MTVEQCLIRQDLLSDRMQRLDNDTMEYDCVRREWLIAVEITTAAQRNESHDSDASRH